MSETLVKDKLPSCTELNNNDSLLNMDLDISTDSNQRVNESASLSSVSSNNSDVSDEAGDKPGKDGEKKRTHRKLRSLSDGHAVSLLKSSEIIEVFPSLPDSVLEKLGISGNGEKERLNEDELEQKFVALSLAFTIDAATIKDRCERQKRYRDQTEINLNNEITKVIDKITQIQPVNMDTEKAEHLTGLLGQIDVIVRAAALASISAERFGAVQHEARLADAVHLMINYVTLLKQQRDSARKQLQYTKKVMQDTNTTETTTVKRLSLGSNGRSLTRRASIAAVAQDTGKPVSPPGTDSKKLLRRTSDISARVSAFAKSSRPSRLELGVDLDKIKEGIVDDNSEFDLIEASDVEEEVFGRGETSGKEVKPRKSITPLVDHMSHQMKRLERYVRERLRVCAENRVFHDCFYITAFVCFMIGFLLLAICLIHTQISGGENTTLRPLKEDFKSNKIKQ